MDKISVIVPVYKVEKYLDKCVESIVNQTYTNLEIILVDDGSPDNCPKICDEWAKKDDRIKVIHKENGGVSSARNAGLDVVTGKYVTYIDSDDYIEPEMINTMHDNIIIDDYDVCVCNHFCVDNNYNIIEKSKQKRNVFCGEEVIQNFLKTDVFEVYTGWTKLYKSSVIIQNNIRFDDSVNCGEDYYFNYYFFKKINKMIAIEDALYNHVLGRDGSITNVITHDSVRRWVLTKNMLLAEKNNLENYRIALKSYAYELICISRELIRSGNKSIINVCYPEIADEVQSYYNDLMNINTNSRFVKISLKLMNFSPKLYLKLYSLYYKLKR